MQDCSSDLWKSNNGSLLVTSDESPNGGLQASNAMACQLAATVMAMLEGARCTRTECWDKGMLLVCCGDPVERNDSDYSVSVPWGYNKMNGSLG